MQKWPSFQQFQDLTNNVDALDKKVKNLPTSSAGGYSLRPEYSEIENVGKNTEGHGIYADLNMVGARLVFSWENYSIAPAGFYVSANITVADIYSFNAHAGTEANASSVYSGELKEHGRGYFEFSELPVLSHGQVEVWFKNPVTIAGFSGASGYTAANLSPGTNVQLYAADGSLVDGLPDAFLTILQPSELPVRPKYTPRGADWLSSQVRSDRAEIIWPASGTPYLLVIGADDSLFHLPLTPGLPQ